MHKFLALILVVAGLSGCSSSQTRLAYIQPELVEGDRVTLAKKENLTPAKVQKCNSIYTVVPTDLWISEKKMIKNACPADHALVDAKFKETFYYIPLIYGQDCVELEGQCAKIN